MVVQEWKWMARWHYFQTSSLAVNVEMDGGELPHDIVLSIQRVLNVDSNTHDDPLDDLSSDFTPVDILNGFFPDGPGWYVHLSKIFTHSKSSSQRHRLAIWMQFRLAWLRMSLNFCVKLAHYRSSWNEIRILVECNLYRKWYPWVLQDKAVVSYWSKL